MSATSESQKSAEPVRTAEKVKQVRAAKPPLPDEKLIDSPTRPTLIILGAISLATLTMWAAGRAACNYRVPGESLTPRTVSIQERTALPKGAGLEFAQALSGGDFSAARSLAAGSALAEVEREAANCPNGCQARIKIRAEVATVADLVQASATEAYVKTRSSTPSGNVTQRLLHVERQGANWRVTQLLPSESPIPRLSSVKPPLAEPSERR